MLLRPAPVEVRLADIAERCGLSVPDPSSADVRVTGITLDSRSVQPGDIFAALPGAHAHGASFIPQARDLGAVAVLTDLDGLASAAGLPALLSSDPRGCLGAVSALVYGEPARDLVLIGVTGTNGKTTTAYLLQAGLRAAGLRAGLIGTTGVLMDGESVPSARTTPEAPDLHALLGVMRERGVQAVAMEVSSHALVLGRVDGLVFDAAVFTNLSQDHLDFHGTMEAYFAAKASLFVPERARLAVIGVDDDWGRRLAVQATVPVTTFAIHHHADVRCVSISPDAQGQALTVVAGPDRTTVRLGIPGDFNAANGLAAWTTLRALGLPAHAADDGMAGVRVPGRMEIVDVGQPFLAVVDYAHSPDSVERVISSPRPGGAPSSFSAAGETATATSARSWGASPDPSPTCSSSPMTIRARRIPPRSGPRCSRGCPRMPMSARSQTGASPSRPRSLPRVRAMCSCSSARVMSPDRRRVASCSPSMMSTPSPMRYP